MEKYSQDWVDKLFKDFIKDLTSLTSYRDSELRSATIEPEKNFKFIWIEPKKEEEICITTEQV